jgi:hypothetical protein
MDSASGTAACTAAVKSCGSFLIMACCFPLLASCSFGQQAHREFYVCVGKSGEGAFFDYISSTAKELGYRPSTGTAEDDRGHVTTVMKATRWTTAIWVTNQIVGPALNDPAGEIIPRHDAFSISVHGLTSAEVGRTYDNLKSKLSHDGYWVNDQRCP